MQSRRGGAVRIRGLDLDVFDGVYPPSEDTLLLMDAVRVESAIRGLELCSGTGAVGLSVAGCVEFMIEIDLSPVAAMNTLHNFRKNEVQAHIIVGDLFSPVRGEFDLIMINPPYLPDGDGALGDLAWSGGASGRSVIDRFLSDVCSFLSSGGRAYMLQSSLNGIKESLETAEGFGLDAEVVARRDFDFESLVVIKMERGGNGLGQAWKS
ncbi:MAG: methyltransferase [Candidatus Methanosuratus sp.]|nr:methyltransferase [Candidatus Methanosuratincola sp.]